MSEDKTTGKNPKNNPVYFEPLNQGPADKDDWHKDLVNRLAFSAINEQRRSRRWSILFKCLLAIYLGAILLLYWPAEWSGEQLTKKKHTALVELKGVISDETEASADNIIEGLRDAFEDKNTAGIILRINTPGGSPVQSGYIYQEIKRLRVKYPDTPIYAVVTDICASGGYYVAAATDEIYVDKASIVGSIGVLMNSFGFVDSMKKLGIERRLYTAGENKGFLDPFSPTRRSDVEHVKKLLKNIHEQFIAAVKEGRGDRLVDNPDLYSGLVWSGEEGVEMGLADGIGSAGYVAREIIGEEDIVDFTPKPDLLERLSNRFGVAMAKSLGELTTNMGSLR